MDDGACCETCERFGDGEAPAESQAPLLVARPGELTIRITHRGETSVYAPAGERVMFGRVAGNDIVLPDATISKRQLCVSIVEGRVVVADLMSACGTFIDGRQISAPTELRAEQVIYAGDFQIRVTGPSDT